MSVITNEESDPNGDGSSATSSHSGKENSSSGASSSGTSGDASNGSRNQSMYGVRRLGITERDQRVVSWSRFAFLLSLLILSSALAAGVYLQVHNDEVEDFEKEVEFLSHDILNLSNDHAHRIANVFNALTRLITSYIIAEHGTNSTLGKGFVTIPDVEEHFGVARKRSGAFLITYVPDVSLSELEAWNQYSTDKQGWIQKSHGSVEVTDSIFPSIWEHPLAEQGSSCDVLGQRRLMSDQAKADRVAVQSDSGSFSPVWTISPPPLADDVGIVNFDLRGKATWRSAMDRISAFKKAAFLNTCNFASWFDSDDHNDPLQTIVAFPVFDGHNQETASVVGHLLAVIPWKAFFEGTLLHEAPRSVVVVENTCNETLSFEVIGIETKFLAHEDRHDKAFEDMAYTESFAQAGAHNIYYDSHGDHSDHVGEGTCLYSISVYPTKEFKDEHVTRQAAAFAAVVVVVFLMTSFLFFLFERFMRRKLERVTKVAVKQNIIVSSLFPKNVQDKLMSEGVLHERMGTAGIKSFLTAQQESGRKTRELMGKPIADLFPATTIMFADIPGFASWSLVREPSQVFTLLESIFTEFDRLAHRRKVFKVEVVGDCYVAVCGLPDPRQDHALVMAKFAMDCLSAMDEVTERLTLELGPDTSTLKLRVGLHSGPVVAGVLRGDKSRFQLFGDTMNTASRMESTGLPRKIQVSQETADLLIAQGKKCWLTQRKDAVTAKGKGELVTFFVARPKDRSQTSVNDINNHASRPSGLDVDELDGSGLERK